MAPDLELRVDRDAGVPVSTQLQWRLRSLIHEGTLGPGDRLPSLRDLAAAAGVNVNTVRAVYARLERDGLVASEQGRGTFVRTAPSAGQERRRLRRQIAALEHELVRRPPASGEGSLPLPAPSGGNLLTTEELAGVRDELMSRLQQLDTARAEVIQRLQELESADWAADEPADEPSETRRSTPSISGVRVSWVGA
jgi:DNA-binding transcriptional regulator YhcF (GntR family)